MVDDLALTILSNKSCTNFELHGFSWSPKTCIYETKFTIQTVHTTTLKSSVILAAPRREFDFFCCGNVQRICQHFKSDSWCAQLIIRHNGVNSFIKENYCQIFHSHAFSKEDSFDFFCEYLFKKNVKTLESEF